MKEFEFEIKKQGKIISGEKKANSKKELAKRLRKQGEIIFINKKKKSMLDFEIKGLDFNLTRGIKTKDITEFCRQFSTMIYAGSTILESLEVLRNEIKNKKLQNKINEVTLEVKGGERFSKALENAKVFPNIFVNMVKAGEESGKLDEVLINASNYLEKQEEFKENLKSALTYPLMMLSFSLIVILVIVNVIIPTFVGQLQGMGAELPQVTVMLMSFSEFVQNNLLLIFLSFVLSVFGLYKYYKTDNGKGKIDNLLIKTPILGNVVVRSNVVKIARTLGILDEAGVGMLKSLDIIGDIINNKIIKQTILDAQGKIEKKGITLSKCLYDNKFLPRTFLLITKIGEESGTLNKVMFRVADDFEEEVDRLTNTLVGMLKPLTIIIMGGIVAILIMSIFLPMFSVMSNF